MDTIRRIREKARAHPVAVALPEYNDARVKEAARIIEQEGIAKVLLVTPDMVDPKERDRYCEEFYQLRKAKGVTPEEVKALFAEKDPLYYTAMMAREGKIGGFVAGAAHTTPDMARAAIYCLGMDPRFGVACSCFIMTVPNCVYGQNGTFIFADCGIVPTPSPRQLASISIAASELGKKVLGLSPRVALMSYSTKGSARGRGIDLIHEALELIRQQAPDLPVDGELQVDAAIVPEVARIKYPDSPIGGQANILIFPSLESGNIGYKLVERLARARALGPLLMGLTRPCSDLSRGCSVEDVVDVVAVTAIRAQ